MALSQSDIVDFLALDDASNRIVVVLVDEHDWSDEHGHMALLQAKLNRYLAFIESGEIREALRQRVRNDVPLDWPILIRVVARFSPAPHGMSFIKKVERVISDAGIGFDLTVRQDPTSQ